MDGTSSLYKKNDNIRLCVDYRELNKRTVKDAYPLPHPDEVQDQLAGSTVFSTLNLQSGYWQLPVHPEDQPKTAFSPGPEMGPSQFCWMPFGLSGALPPSRGSWTKFAKVCPSLLCICMMFLFIQPPWKITRNIFVYYSRVCHPLASCSEARNAILAWTR